MADSSLRAWLLLRAVPGVGDAVLLKLIEAFGELDAVLASSVAALMEAGCRASLAEAIVRGPDASAREAADRELEQAAREGIDVLTVLDPHYPARLRVIPDPPPLLYVKGTVTSEDQTAVAIVGARRASEAGRLFTEELARELVAAGLTIVSGLARGIDGAAHRGALAANGRTLAVMGCGLDRTYPPQHRLLRAEIEQHGAVLSDLPLGAQPLSHHFPRRNRIISGLALGVIVTESTLESGSLITARLAGEQGREVFAVPGSVKYEGSRGPHKLLREGARLVESAADVIEELWPQLDIVCKQRFAERVAPVKKSDHRFGKEESLVYDAVSCEPRTIDEIIQSTGLAAHEVSAALLGLELKQAIRPLPGQVYIRPLSEPFSKGWGADRP